MATLLAMRTRVVQEGDLGGHMDLTNATDKAVIDAQVNSSLQQLHDVLTMRFQDYQLTGSAAEYLEGRIIADSFLSLDARCLKLRDVEYLGNSIIYNAEESPISLLPFAWSERNRVLGGERKYCLAQTQILLRPLTISRGLYQHWFTPKFVALAADGDNYDAINGWEKMAILDAAIALKDGIEKDTTVLRERFKAIADHVEEAAAVRLAAGPTKVRRVVKRWYEIGQDPSQYNG